MTQRRPVNLVNLIDYIDLTADDEQDIYDFIAARRQVTVDLQRAFDAVVDGVDRNAELLMTASKGQMPREIIAKIMSYESRAFQSEQDWYDVCL